MTKPHMPGPARSPASTRVRPPALAAGEVEFELSDGGQHRYWWLLAAE